MTKRQKETAKRRAEGRCLSCGKPAAPLVSCQQCGRKANEYRKAKKARQ
jgi:ribosomal protein S14